MWCVVYRAHRAVRLMIDGVAPVKSIESGIYAGYVQKYDISGGVSSGMIGAGADQRDRGDIE